MYFLVKEGREAWSGDECEWLCLTVALSLFAGEDWAEEKKEAYRIVVRPTPCLKLDPKRS